LSACLCVYGRLFFKIKNDRSSFFFFFCFFFFSFFFFRLPFF